MAQKVPKFQKKWSFSHSISIKYIVVTPKTLPTHIIVKTIAKTYFEQSRYSKWPPFALGVNFVKKCKFLYSMSVLCLKVNDKVIVEKIMNGGKK